jgi:hypothetical protein
MVSFHRREVDWNIEDVDRLAGKERAGGGPRFGFIVEFDVVVKTVLEERKGEVSRGSQYGNLEVSAKSYMVPVRSSHLQSPVTAASGSGRDSPVTYDIRERVATLPIATAPPLVPFHAIFPRKIVPRAQELH